MSDKSSSGSCLCGKVEYSITSNMGIFQYCHCSRCRKFTGSAFSSSLIVSPADFTWVKGEEFVGRFEPSGLKYFATSFCKHCGSSLPWLAQSGQVVIVPAGTLDQDPQIRPMQNIYCASDATWYTSPSELPEFDELPPRK